MENITTKNNLANERLPDSLARKLLLSALPGLAEGHLSLIDGDKSYEFGRKESDLHATIIVNNPRFYRQILLSGSIGAGEAYIQAHWTSPDLTKVVLSANAELSSLWRRLRAECHTLGFSAAITVISRHPEAGLGSGTSGPWLPDPPA